MRQYTPDNRGFTLLELMLVIALVGILASIATPSYLNYAQRARATQCHVDRGEAQNVIRQYCQDHPDTELTSLQQLIDAGYLRRGFNCPLGGEYVLIPAKTVGSQYPVIACSLHYMPEMVSQEESGTPEQSGTPQEPEITEQSGTPEEPEQTGGTVDSDKKDKGKKEKEKKRGDKS
jgi:prepilin-type N-terminal cleavage/methylation domain-containing protein